MKSVDIKQLREAFAEALENLVTDPTTPVADANVFWVKAVRAGSRIPARESYTMLFARVCQNLRIDPEDSVRTLRHFFHGYL